MAALVKPSEYVTSHAPKASSFIGRKLDQTWNTWNRISQSRWSVVPCFGENITPSPAQRKERNLLPSRSNFKKRK
ncbi:hypothetical protein DPMN_130531 [Dreissena polymorpha]|uniref:Uncharacterized protein n=1 Tax=Dreissena polymorpha TaxID=45954 RepID=A0A9D4H4U0_DREPO|nr:hypothetical protein DPMN_130531 [Dreissena polymorpha]